VDFAPTDADTSLQKSMGFRISIDVDTININTDHNINTDSEAHRFFQCMIFTNLSPISQASSRDDPATICNVCRKEFSSRNKMFQHIKETGHAVNVSVTTTNSGVSKSSENTRRKGRRKK